MELLRQTWWLLRKEWMVEWRSRVQLTTLFFFAVLALGVFGLSLQVGPGVQRQVMPGVLWVTFAFACTLGMGRLYSPEMLDGCLEGLRMSPVAREAIFLAKQMSLFLYLLLCALWAVPLAALMFQVEFGLLWSAVIPVVLLGLWGISILGTMMATLLLHTRHRDALMPLLFLPVALPLLIGCARATAEILGVGGVSHTSFWLRGLLFFDLMFLLASLWLFAPQMEG